MSCNEGVTLIMYGYPEKWLEGMTTGEGIAAELRLGIVNGHIAEGTLLTENQMAKQFNVSRSPIRDAFKLKNKYKKYKPCVTRVSDDLNTIYRYISNNKIIN